MARGIGLATAVILGAALGVVGGAATTASAQVEGGAAAVEPDPGKSAIGVPTKNGAPEAINTRRQTIGTVKPDQPSTSPAASASENGLTSFGDWNLECFSPAVNGVRCQLIHQTLSGDQKQVLYVMSLAYVPTENQVNIQMALPLGFALQPGVRLEIGKNYQSNIPVSRCTGQGCLIEGIAAPELIASMRGSSAGTTSVQTSDGAPVSFPLPLAGFNEAFAEMERRNREASTATARN